MIGQIQVLDIPNLSAATDAILQNKAQLMAAADACSSSIVRRGGGSRDVQVRAFPNSPVGPMLVLHLLYDTRDAMGANAINTAVESIAPRIEELTGGRVNLRILSNLTDQRRATARCTIPAAALARPDLPAGRTACSRASTTPSGLNVPAISQALA